MREGHKSKRPDGELHQQGWREGERNSREREREREREASGKVTCKRFW